MELLKFLLGVSLICVSAKDATSNNSAVKLNRRIYRESTKEKRYSIELTSHINDYKNTDIYKAFKSYIDEQRAKDNLIFYGQSTMVFQDMRGLHTISLRAQNLKIDETATEIVFTLDDTNSVIYKPNMHEYYEETQTVVLYFDDVVLPVSNTYRLSMKFVGSNTIDKTRGFVKKFSSNNEQKHTWVI